jgi:NitT/TauT family transport system substrate-binding protein
MRFNNKVPVKVMAWDHTNGSAVTVRGESGIEGFADFEGKQIAVPYWYSMHNVILQMGLRKAGLKPVIRDQAAPLKSKEVNLFILPPPEMPAALLSGKMDGYIVAEPFNALGELKFGAKILRFTGDMWKNHPCCVVVMNENLVRSRPVFTQKVINAVVRAQLWTSNNLSEAAWILGRNGGNYLPVTEDVLHRVFSGYELSVYGPGRVPQAIQHPDWSARRIGFQPFPYPSATRLIVREMANTEMEGNKAFLEKLDPTLAATELVDDSFVIKAIENAGGLGQFTSSDIRAPFDTSWEREEVVLL